MRTTTYSLTEFVNDVKHVISIHSGPKAQALEVGRLMEQLLSEPEFLRQEMAVPKVQRNRYCPLYEDPDSGFMVLAHWQPAGHQTPPHNHGPYWVVYGVYENVIEMTRYQRLDSGKELRVARLKSSRSYELERGEVNFFVPGDIHSTRNPSLNSSLILRVTQKDLTKISRERFDVENNRVLTD